MTAWWSLPHRMPRIFLSAIAVSRTVRFAVRRRGCNERITRADLVSVLSPPPSPTFRFLLLLSLSSRERGWNNGNVHLYCFLNIIFSKRSWLTASLPLSSLSLSLSLSSSQLFLRFRRLYLVLLVKLGYVDILLSRFLCLFQYWLTHNYYVTSYEF